MNYTRKEVEDLNTNENFKNVYNVLGNLYLGGMTATQIGNLNKDELQPGVMAYDQTADELKIMVLDGGVKTFKTVTVS